MVTPKAQMRRGRGASALYMLKLSIMGVIVLILCWNMSMLAVMEQPDRARAVHLLRGNEQAQELSEEQPPSVEAVAPTLEEKEDKKPQVKEKEVEQEQRPFVASRDPVKRPNLTPEAPRPQPVPQQRLQKPWFLDPSTYERESGCDFSGAVRIFDPAQLEINCNNIHELKLGQRLGEGFWREVYKASWRDRDLAVKLVKEELMDRSDIIPRHVEEAAVIFPVRNEPNIVGLVGWCNTTVVVDFVPTPMDDIVFDRQYPISVERALEFARDAARGLQQLHSAEGGPFAHTDIQTRQFLMNSEGIVQLNDFNRVKYTGPKRLPDGTDSNEKCLFRTPVAKGKWRSPEEYQDLDLDEKLDIYSLSLVLWGFRSREKPFAHLTKSQVYHGVPRGMRPPVEAMSDYPKEMQDLIVQSWDQDPKKRPSAAELAKKIDEILTQYRASLE